MAMNKEISIFKRLRLRFVIGKEKLEIYVCPAQSNIQFLDETP